MAHADAGRGGCTVIDTGVRVAPTPDENGPITRLGSYTATSVSILKHMTE